MENQTTYLSCNKSTSYSSAFFLLFILLVFFFILSICMGSVAISLTELIALLKGETTSEIYQAIVYEIRMPRAIAAILLGGALALSGYLLQTFFQNPIAGPFVLGISSGAKMSVALMMIIFLEAMGQITSVQLIIAAFAGALLSMGVVLLIAKKIYHISVLILAGVMIGYICSAITDFIVTFADDANIVNLHEWSMGSFSGISWTNIRIIVGVIMVTFFLVFLLSKPIEAFQLGEAYAANMGVNIPLFRIKLVILSSILAASVTAFAGPISFVGIAVPQMIKRIFHTSKPMIMIPACFMGGGIFCMFCDLLARTIFAPTELNISTVTAIFGAPVVMVVMIKRHSGVYRG